MFSFTQPTGPLPIRYVQPACNSYQTFGFSNECCTFAAPSCVLSLLFPVQFECEPREEAFFLFAKQGGESCFFTKKHSIVILQK